MSIGIQQLPSRAAILFILAACAYGSEIGERKTVTLARHETIAEFLGTNYHRCMGLTSLCPDQCGHSGTNANFRISRYVKYEKSGEYGDPKCDRFVFMIEDNKKRSKVSRDIQETVASLKKGDGVLLSWSHDYVTADGGSGPERPIVKLKKIAHAGTQAWMEQVELVVGTRDALEHGPTIGSEEWMIAVSRKLEVRDADGHGPDLHTGEWRSAIHRKAFGIEPETNIVVVYRSADGKELRVTYDNLRQKVTLHTSQRDITLPQVVSASGARYAAGDEEFWNKGSYAAYTKGGTLLFEGNDQPERGEQPHAGDILKVAPEE